MMTQPARVRTLTVAVLSVTLALLLGSLALSAGTAPDAEENSSQPTTTPLAEAAAPLVETQDGQIVFRDPLDDSLLEVPLPEGDELTNAVAEFHQTGLDPYDADDDAKAAGKKLYLQWCQACHMPDGSGRLGPSLIDDAYKYERTGTDVGKFEIIWVGGLGAMQSFATRLTQDEILQVIAHINELKAAATP